MEDEESDEEAISKITETNLEETPERWCSVCNRYVETKGKKKNICKECGSFTAKYKPEENTQIKGRREAKQEAKLEKQDKEYKMSSLRPINLTGREMALAEILINAGLAKNFNDLTRKGLYVMSAMFNLPHGQKMEENQNQTPNPKNTLKELQEQKLIEAYIDSMKKGNSTDPLQMMMLIRMMDNRGMDKGEHEGNNFMEKLMQLQMIKSMSQPNADSQLSKELADLKYQMQMQQILQNQQKNPSLNDQLLALEKVRSERDERIKAAELQVQQERDKTLSIAIDTKLKEMERSVNEARQGGISSQRIKDLKEEIQAIKEMASEIGAREKGAGEYISETIGNVASTLQPTLTKLIEQRQQPHQMPEPIYQMPPEPEMPQMPEQPQVNLPSEMSDSERQISERMSKMYIK